MSKIFSEEFSKIDAKLVSKQISEKGWFCFPNALTKDAVKSIEEDATQSKLSLNKNTTSGVYIEKQYYLTNLLTVSKTFYDFCTSNFVFGVCREYLGAKFRLKAMRYYETYGGTHMQWHTDNKTDRGFAHIPGLIFIFYVSDVQEGQFQYVEGSHLWSGEKAYSDYSEEFIKKNYKDKVKDFKYPAGSLVIYNTYGIHRAEPVFKKNFIRKSVFFQVDSEVDNSEPIILSPKFITSINKELQMFLGFGKPADYEVFPNTSINTLPFTGNLVGILFKYVFYRMARNLYNRIPKRVREKFKGVLKK